MLAVFVVFVSSLPKRRVEKYKWKKKKLNPCAQIHSTKWQSLTFIRKKKKKQTTKSTSPSVIPTHCIYSFHFSTRSNRTLYSSLSLFYSTEMVLFAYFTSSSPLSVLFNCNICCVAYNVGIRPNGICNANGFYRIHFLPLLRIRAIKTILIKQWFYSSVIRYLSFFFYYFSFQQCKQTPFKSFKDFIILYSTASAVLFLWRTIQRSIPIRLILII